MVAMPLSSPPALPPAALTAREACRLCRSAPPLPLKPSESKGSGGFPFQALAAVWGLCEDFGRFVLQSFATALRVRQAPNQKPSAVIDAISEAR